MEPRNPPEPQKESTETLVAVPLKDLAASAVIRMRQDRQILALEERLALAESGGMHTMGRSLIWSG